MTELGGGVSPVEPFEARESSNGGGLMTAASVAALLAVPTSWVYAETRAGRMPHVVQGPRYRRYERHVIEAWWADLRRGPTVYRTYAPGRGSSSQPEGARDER